MTIKERLDNLSQAQPNGCKLWTGSRKCSGPGRPSYGLVRVKVGNKWVTKKAHRIAFEEYYGYTPEGDVDHNREIGCQGGLCIEPTHLREMSAHDNRREGIQHRWKMQAELKLMDKTFSLKVEID